MGPAVIRSTGADNARCLGAEEQMEGGLRARAPGLGSTTQGRAAGRACLEPRGHLSLSRTLLQGPVLAQIPGELLEAQPRGKHRWRVFFPKVLVIYTTRESTSLLMSGVRAVKEKTWSLAGREDGRGSVPLAAAV